MKNLIYILIFFPGVLFSQPSTSGPGSRVTVSNATQLTGLSLDSCLNLAVRNNFRIKQAASEVAQSEQLKKSAFTNYFPKVNAGFSAVKMSDYLIKSSIPQMNLPVYDGNPVNLRTATQFAYFPGLSLNLVDYMNLGYAMAAQPIFTGGRIFYGNKLAGTGYEISQQKKSMTETEVMVRTEELYWTTLSLMEKLGTVDSYQKLLDTLNRDVTAALNAGLVKRNDLLKVRLKQNELEENRRKLTEGIELSKKALCQHIGIPYDNSLGLTDTVGTMVNPLQIVVDPDLAVRNRNEYKMLEKAVHAEKLQKKMVMGEYLPQVSVGVAGVYTDVMDKTDELGIAFATVSIPISDWWGGSHKIRQSQAKVESAGYRLQETGELLSLQITQVQNELNQNFFHIGYAEKSLNLAQENLKITRDNYDAGTAGMSELLEAQSVLEEALNNLTEAKCNYQISLAKYKQAINDYDRQYWKQRDSNAFFR
ncbi:MAG TPA: TolC family protein [Prolixibacteraceae bacterium]|nr:TolC family protein [Prolixibacteraceae bacterium]